MIRYIVLGALFATGSGISLTAQTLDLKNEADRAAHMRACGNQRWWDAGKSALWLGLATFAADRLGKRIKKDTDLVAELAKKRRAQRGRMNPMGPMLPGMGGGDPETEQLMQLLMAMQQQGPPPAGSGESDDAADNAGKKREKQLEQYAQKSAQAGKRSEKSGKKSIDTQAAEPKPLTPGWRRFYKTSLWGLRLFQVFTAYQTYVHLKNAIYAKRADWSRGSKEELKNNWLTHTDSYRYGGPTYKGQPVPDQPLPLQMYPDDPGIALEQAGEYGELYGKIFNAMRRAKARADEVNAGYECEIDYSGYEAEIERLRNLVDTQKEQNSPDLAATQERLLSAEKELQARKTADSGIVEAMRNHRTILTQLEVLKEIKSELGKKAGYHIDNGSVIEQWRDHLKSGYLRNIEKIRKLRGLYDVNGNPVASRPLLDKCGLGLLNDWRARASAWWNGTLESAPEEPNTNS